MLRPGLISPNTLMRLTVSYVDDNGAPVDPTTVKFKLMSEETIAIKTYTYGIDSNLGKTSTGNYYADVTPDHGGRWFTRWEATGAVTQLAIDDNFIVQASPFVNQPLGFLGDYS